MSKKDEAQAKEILEDFVENKYDERTDAIAKKNLHLSMKLSGLLSMMDAYYTEYIQNKKEIVRVAKTMVLDGAKTPKHIEHIARNSQGQMRKLNNQSHAFDKFSKRFGIEFSDLFNDADLTDQLIDTFEAYWDDTVTIEDKTVTIKIK